MTGVTLGSAPTVSATLMLPNGTTIANPLYAEALQTYTIEDQFRAGQITLAQTFNTVLPFAGSDAAVAYDTYKFFTGQILNSVGEGYLLDPAKNANALDGPVYYGVSEANRFMNLAASLGSPGGAGTAGFSGAYGQLSFDAAVRQAYETVIGTGNALAAGFDVNKAIAYIDSQQAYFTQVGGGTDIGAKAAMVGYLMSAGWDAQLGNYYFAAHDYLAQQVTLAGQPAPAGMIPLLSGH